MRNFFITILILILIFFSIFNNIKFHIIKFADFTKARQDYLEAAFYIEYYGNFKNTGNISDKFFRIIQYISENKEIDKLKRLSNEKFLTFRSRSIIYIEMFRYYRNVNFPHLGEPYLEKALQNIKNSGDIKEKLEIYSKVYQDYRSIFKDEQCLNLEKEIISLLEEYSYFDYSDNADIFFEACFIIKDTYLEKLQSFKDIEEFFLKKNILKLSDFYYYFSKYLPDKMSSKQKQWIESTLDKIINKNKLTPEEIFIMTNLLYANMKTSNNLNTFNYLKKYFDNKYFDERIIDIYRLCVEQNEEKCTNYIYDNLTLKYGISSFLLTSIKGVKLLENKKHIKSVKEIYRTYQEFKDLREKNPEYIKFLAKSGELDKAIECSEFYHDSLTIAEIGIQMKKYKKRPTPASQQILIEILRKYEN